MHCGDALTVLQSLPAGSVQTCITSPPYWGLRDYGVVGQLGLEPTPEAYVAALVAVFREVRRVLRDDGTLWCNLGDSYSGGGGYSPDSPSNQGERWVTNCGKARTYKGREPASGLKPKDLVGIPWRVAFALQADGWYLRSDIIWAKPNPMPESVTDRPTKAHEYLFLLAKSERYFFDAEAVKERATGHDPGSLGAHAGNKFDRSNGNRNGLGDGSLHTLPSSRNIRSVWTVATAPYPEAHFATFPPDLIKPCVLAGSRVGDTVLDPFAGAGTTLYVAKELGRSAIGIELNPEYIALAEKRMRQEVLPL